MKKIISILVTSIFLVACQTTPEKEIVYVDKPIPVYIVPKPPKVEKPDLLYKQYSTPEKKQELKNNPGKAARVARLSLAQYEGYVSILESIINKYDELADKSKKKLDDLSNVVIDGPLAASAPEEPEATEDYLTVNHEHLKDIILTEDYFGNLEKKSKENIENAEAE